MKTKTSEVLEARFLTFGVNVIRMAQQQKNALPFSVIDQVIRSATSIGANYSEAQNASSRTDFRNKIFIAKKEASETRYWLNVIAKLTGQEQVSGLLQEAQEILLILQKITTTLKEKAAK